MAAVTAIKARKTAGTRTKRLMLRVNDIVTRRGITTAILAKEIGANYCKVSEWINGNRSAPNSEWTLALEQWCQQHEPTAIQQTEDALRDFTALLQKVDTTAIPTAEKPRWGAMLMPVDAFIDQLGVART